jgi:formylglycine-generating enzyme required for sulfatase activity
MRPPPSKKSRAPLFIVAGVAAVMLAVVAALVLTNRSSNPIEIEAKRLAEEQQRKLAEQLEREKKEAEARGKAFTDFQTQLLDLLKDRRYADAEKLAQDKLADPFLAAYHGVIAAWRDAVQRANRFWTALPAAVAKLENREFLPKDLGALLSQLATESVLELLDMLKPDAQMSADAAWFCFAEQKFDLALARVAAADREKMTRLERDSRDIVKQQRIAQLLAFARANDNKQNGQLALAALAEILNTLDPQHKEALELRAKISAYYDANFTNTIGMEMVWLPKNGANGGYYVGKYEVTQAEYEKVMGKNPSYFKDPRKPVEAVSWDEAMEFCKRLTDIERKAGGLREGWVYTLPTEKQWEYFVGDADLKDAVTSKDRPRKSTERVGSLGKNKFGLYDVRGNVWEWCAYWYDSSQKYRVLRGASWGDSSPAILAVSFRDDSTPFNRYSNIGFRCVLVGGASSLSR